MPDDTPDLPEAPNVDSPPSDAVAKLATAEKQLHDYKLIVSDYENARRRQARDAEVAKKYAHEPLVKDLLGALDNLDRALEAAKKVGDAGPLAVGVAATASQFLAVLQRHGVTRMDVTPGTVFDPNRHEAVMEQPTPDFPPGSVVQVLQSGYQLHDRVLRPASVIVSAQS